MGRHEDIDSAIWSDRTFAGLTPNAKLVYLWSFTNPRCNMSGLYKTTEQAIAFDTGLSVNAVLRALDELRDTSLAFYEEDVLWVRSRVRHMHARSPKMAISIAKDVKALNPSHPLSHAFMACYQAENWLEQALSGVTLSDPIDTLPAPSLDGPLTGTGPSSTRNLEGEVDARTRELCEQLSRSCREITAAPASSSKYRVTRDWLVDMDRLVRLDGRDPDKVAEAIRWAHADPFWRKVILSPRKLREHYDAMRLAASGQPSASARDAARLERTARRQQAQMRVIEGGDAA